MIQGGERLVDVRCVKILMIIPSVLCSAMAVEGEMAFCCNKHHSMILQLLLDPFNANG